MKYLLAFALLFSFAATADAARSSAANSSGRSVVTHNRKAPVAMHRALPPYGVGKHVYAGR